MEYTYHKPSTHFVMENRFNGYEPPFYPHLLELDEDTLDGLIDISHHGMHTFSENQNKQKLVEQLARFIVEQAVDASDMEDIDLRANGAVLIVYPMSRLSKE